MGQRLIGASPLVAGSINGMVVPRHGSLRAAGVDGDRRLHYCDWGNPANPRVVVCIHGRGRNARDFDTLARELAPDYRVICPDLPGRREGDWLGTAMVQDASQMVADLDALLSELGVGNVDLIFSDDVEFLGHIDVRACANQRSLRAGACSRASTSRSTRMGLVR